VAEVYPIDYICQVLLGDPLVLITCTSRLGAGRVVAVHDLAGAAAADALVVRAARNGGARKVGHAIIGP